MRGAAQGNPAPNAHPFPMLDGNSKLFTLALQSRQLGNHSANYPWFGSKRLSELTAFFSGFSPE
jgi:hypothetical protein